MREVFRIVLSLSLSGSLLFLVVLGVSRLLKDRLSKAWHYYVWLLVILRFLLPVAPAINPVGAVFQGVSALLVEGPATEPYVALSTAPPYEGDVAAPGVIGTVQPYYGESAPEGRSFLSVLDTVLQWLWVPWLGVALALLLRKVTLYQSFAAYIRAGNTEVSDPAVLNRLAEACESLGIHRQIELYENPLTATPLMLGFFRPAVVLPSIHISDTEFRYIMLHELTHYRRGDIFYKWLVQLTLCLHWFNPLAYLLSKEVNAAGELSCDEAVIGRLSRPEQQAYGDVLIASLQNPGTYKQALAGLTLSENAQTVKERLQAIMKYHKIGFRSIALSMLLTLLLATGGVALGAATPGMTAESVFEVLPLSLEGKPEAYKLMAQMREVDTAQSVADYTGAIQKICEDAGTDLFAVLADSGITEPADPLYAFSTGTLARTSSEVYATHFPEQERPMVFGNAAWERYATDAEKAAELEGFSEEERQAFQDATKDDPEYPVSMKYVFYFLFYDITAPEGLTIDERDERLDAVLADMQSYLDGLSEEEVFAEGFQDDFTAALQQATEQHTADGMTMEAEFSSAEGYINGEPIF